MNIANGWQLVHTRQQLCICQHVFANVSFAREVALFVKLLHMT